MAENMVTIPKFSSSQEFSTFAHSISSETVQAWSTKNWLEMFENLADYVDNNPEFDKEFRSYIEEGVRNGTFTRKEAAEHLANPKSKRLYFASNGENCEALGLLYRNFHFEEADFNAIRAAATKAGTDLAYSGSVDASKLAISVEKRGGYFSDLIPQPHSMANTIRHTGELVDNTVFNGSSYVELVDSKDVLSEIRISNTAGGSASQGTANSTISYGTTYGRRQDALMVMFHESAHAHLQNATPWQQNLFSSDGIKPLEGLSDDFCRLMQFNNDFYIDPTEFPSFKKNQELLDNAFNHHLPHAEISRLSREQDILIDYYRRQPIEKFSNLYGAEAERSFRQISGQFSERAALNISNQLTYVLGKPSNVSHTENGVLLSYKPNSNERHLKQKIEQCFHGLDKDILDKINLQQARDGTISFIVPKDDVSSQQLLNKISDNKNTVITHYGKYIPQKTIKQDLTNLENQVSHFNQKMSEKLAQRGGDKIANAGTSALRTATTSIGKANARFDAFIDSTVKRSSDYLNNSFVGTTYYAARDAVMTSKPVVKLSSYSNLVLSSTKAFLASRTSVKAAAKVGAKAIQKGSRFVLKYVEKSGTKAAVKGGAKFIAKKIPVISVATGGYFAIERAINGEWTAAGAELASGVASTVPGAGTAVSVGIDASLVGYDYLKDDEEMVEQPLTHDQQKRMLEIYKNLHKKYKETGNISDDDFYNIALKNPEDMHLFMAAEGSDVFETHLMTEEGELDYAQLEETLNERITICEEEVKAREEERERLKNELKTAQEKSIADIEETLKDPTLSSEERELATHIVEDYKEQPRQGALMKNRRSKIIERAAPQDNVPSRPKPPIELNLPFGFKPYTDGR